MSFKLMSFKLEKFQWRQSDFQAMENHMDINNLLLIRYTQIVNEFKVVIWIVMIV